MMFSLLRVLERTALYCYGNVVLALPSLTVEIVRQSVKQRIVSGSAASVDKPHVRGRKCLPGKARSQQGGAIMSKSDLFEKGLEVRKEVLGEDYVNKSIAGADEFTRTMAEWSTEFCWGALWTRPGLDRRTRSIINLAMLGALGRPHELKLHVKGALKNGVTKDEIKEILLQVAVYCGVPAGIDAFRNAREAFKELDGE
jgi:4-carboxymuconolactone decarboxylase